MQDHEDLLLLLVGDGVEKERLQKLAAQMSLSNVRFEGFVSRGSYPDLLNICSIGLVCLSPKNQTPVVPGKILGYMAAGLPIVAFLNSASDGHAIIKNAACGVSADSGNIAACAAAMRELLKRHDAFSEIGARGKKYAATHFSREGCVSKMESLLRENTA